jgi:hypothetical protein
MYTTHVIEISNEAPTVNLVITESSEQNTYYIDSHSVDPEGLLDYTIVKVYADSAYILNGDGAVEQWVELDLANMTGSTATLKFYTSGRYKVEVQAVDQGGLRSVIDSRIVTVLCDGIGTASETGSVFVEINGELLGAVDVIPVSADLEVGSLDGDIEQDDVDCDFIEEEVDS